MMFTLGPNLGYDQDIVEGEVTSASLREKGELKSITDIW